MCMSVVDVLDMSRKSRATKARTPIQAEASSKAGRQPIGGKWASHTCITQKSESLHTLHGLVAWCL